MEPSSFSNRICRSGRFHYAWVHLRPALFPVPLVALATVATVIASQAVISGALSITRQAIQLGYSPRMEVQHTSEKEIGQIYLPGINWSLFLAVVQGFRSSTNLGEAYGRPVDQGDYLQNPKPSPPNPLLEEEGQFSLSPQSRPPRPLQFESPLSTDTLPNTAPSAYNLRLDAGVAQW
jgi:hypothetical protein